MVRIGDSGTQPCTSFGVRDGQNGIELLLLLLMYDGTVVVITFSANKLYFASKHVRLGENKIYYGQGVSSNVVRRPLKII